MSRAPRLAGIQLISAIERAGFLVVRLRGGYHFLRHGEGRSTVLPVRSGETIGSGLLHEILRDCKLTVEELETLLRS